MVVNGRWNFGGLWWGCSHAILGLMGFTLLSWQWMSCVCVCVHNILSISFQYNLCVCHYCVRVCLTSSINCFEVNCVYSISKQKLLKKIHTFKTIRKLAEWKNPSTIFQTVNNFSKKTKLFTTYVRHLGAKNNLFLQQQQFFCLVLKIWLLTVCKFAFSSLNYVTFNHH